MQICDYEKKIEESAIKLKQQQNRCEAVRTERNLYSKKLIEAKVEGYIVSLCFSLCSCFFSWCNFNLLKGKLTGKMAEVISSFLCVLGKWMFWVPDTLSGQLDWKYESTVIVWQYPCFKPHIKSRYTVATES